MITRTTFETLAKRRGRTLATAYMPTHRAGRDTSEDPIRLKNLIAEIEERCDAAGRDPNDLEGSMSQMRALVDDNEFWRHQSDGLALFAENDSLEIHRLGYGVETLATVGDRFCVRPLLRAVSDGSRFYILALSQGLVRVFDCTREHARELDARDIPDSLADALGYDYEQRTLQFHTGAPPAGGPGAGRTAVFHGQGRAGDQQKDELREFLKRVDDGLNKLLSGEYAPLVIAAVEYEAAMFREHTRYENTAGDIVRGSPDHKSAEDLHAEALPIAGPLLDRERARARDLIAEGAHSGDVACGVHEVLPAAIQGAAATLLVRPESPVWGVFHGATNKTELHTDREAGDEDLIDLAIAQAVATGADVRAAGPDDVPDDRRVAALRRF